MILQSTPYTCGPAALANALHAWGQDDLGEHELAILCGTCPIVGTPTVAIKRAVRACGFLSRAQTFVNIKSAHRGLVAALMRGNPCILAVQGDSHWACAVGALGSRVLVADSAKGELVLSMDFDELQQYWKSSKNRFYLIEICEKAG